jgi:hypothetical protein
MNKEALEQLEAKKQLNKVSDKALLLAVRIRTAKSKEQLSLIGPDLYALNMELLELLKENEADYIKTMSNQIIPVLKEDKQEQEKR